MLYELYRTLEHKSYVLSDDTAGTFSGAPLPLRSIYVDVAPARFPLLHP